MGSNVQKDVDESNDAQKNNGTRESKGNRTPTERPDLTKNDHMSHPRNQSVSTPDTEFIYFSKSKKSSEDKVYHSRGSRDVERNTPDAYKSFCDQIVGDTSRMG